MTFIFLLFILFPFVCVVAGSNLVRRVHHHPDVGMTELVARVGTNGEAETETETGTGTGTETEKGVVMTIVGKGIAHTSYGNVVLPIGGLLVLPNKVWWWCPFPKLL